MLVRTSSDSRVSIRIWLRISINYVLVHFLVYFSSHEVMNLTFFSRVNVWVIFWNIFDFMFVVNSWRSWYFHDHTSWVSFLLFNFLHRILSFGLSHILLIAIIIYKSFGQYSIKQKRKRFIVPVAVFLCDFSEFSSFFAAIEDRLITTIFKTNRHLCKN